MKKALGKIWQSAVVIGSTTLVQLFVHLVIASKKDTFPQIHLGLPFEFYTKSSSSDLECDVIVNSWTVGNLILIFLIIFLILSLIPLIKTKTQP